MQVDRRVSQPVRFSSMFMGELVRMLFRTPRRVLPDSGGVGSKVLFVQRKGTREMINYEVVYDRMVTHASPLGVRVVRANFDEMSLVESKYDPDPKFMQVFVVDIQGLSALVLHAVDMVLTKVHHTEYH